MEEREPDILVAVVDDDANIRAGLWWLLNNIAGMRCSGAYPNVADAFAGLAGGAPHVLLLDVSLPGRSGLEAIRPLRRAYPAMKIVMHSNYDDHDKIIEAIDAGAAGYVLKNVSAPQLYDAIRRVHRGETVWPPGYPPRRRRAHAVSWLQRLTARLRAGLAGLGLR